MIEVREVRENAKKYLVFSQEHALDDYEWRMLEANQPDGLLPVTVHYINNISELWYEITDLSPISVYGKEQKWQPQEIKQLLARIWSVGKNIEGYLLEIERICLEPDYIFCNIYGELFFCYIPGEEKCDQEQLKRLLWFFLRHMDDRDMEQATALYRCYHQMEKNGVGVAELLSRIEAEMPENQRENSPYDLLLREGGSIENRPMLLSDTVGNGTKAISQWNTDQKDDGKKGLFHRWKKGRVSGATETGNRSKQKASHENGNIQAAGSHCFLRNLGEVILETAELDHSPFVIGSSRKDCDLWLTDPAVSRTHAELTFEEQRWYLTDTDSVNGTKWNQNRLRPGEKQELSPGDQIEFAGIVYVFDHIKM